MLQSLNRVISGWMANVIIGIIAVCFVLWGVENYLLGSGDSNTVAKVGNIKISAQQFQASFLDHQKQVLEKFQGTQLTDAQLQAIKAETLESLVQSYALSNFFTEQGMGISKLVQDETLMQFPELQVNGQFSNTLFEQKINASPAGSIDQFLNELRARLLQSQFENGLYQSDFVLPNEVSAAYQLIHQTRDLKYTEISAAKYSNTDKPNEQAISAYYKAHQKDFITPAKIQVNYLVLSLSNILNRVTVSEAEAKKYYDENNAQYFKNNTLQPFALVSASIMTHLKQQKAQQQYADLSSALSDKLYSNSDNLAAAAELLGQTIKTSDWVNQGQTGSDVFADPKVQKVLFSSTVLQEKVNSDPIDLGNNTVYAFHVKDYQAGQVQPLSVVKDKIVAQLQKQMVQEKLVAEAGHIVTAEAGDPLLQGLVWKDAKNVDRQNKTLLPAVLSRAFALSSAQPKAAVPLANGDYAVVELLAVHQPESQQATALTQEQQLLSAIHYVTTKALVTRAIVAKTAIKTYEDTSRV